LIINDNFIEKMKDPMVTVLMSVFNGEKYLSEAIESILNQTFTDFEFLIINDGSTDSSRDIIASYKDTRIILIDNETNIGLTRSLNKGIDLAKGKYIARMDADDISMPYRLTKQLAFLERNPDISLVGSSAMVIDRNGKELNTINADIQPDQIYPTLFFGNTFVHTSIMGDHQLFKKFRYDPSVPYAQDYLLWSQIAKENKIANIKEPLVKYRIHNESISTSKIDKQEACVKRTFAFHLAQLGIKNCSEKQLEFHYQILRKNFITEELSRKENFKILKWIDMLKRKNNKKRIYNESFFNNSLARYWKYYFIPSYKHGLRVLPFVFNSFNKQMKLKEKLWFICQCIRMEAKNWFGAK
jgi:glycosyltransferase involved in cell wall biosynthesis